MKHSFLSAIITLLIANTGFAQMPVTKAILLDDLTILEGTVENFDGVIRVTPSVGEAKLITLKQVTFAGNNRDAVYEFVSGKVDTSTADGCTKLAGWCEKVGMAERALTHAKAGLAITPTDATLRESVARLEKSLAKKPLSESASKPVAAKVVDKPVALPSEATIAFTARVQPILQNQCVSCHASKTYEGTFKLTRISEGYANPEATAANLTAVMGQLSRDNPANSPLLAYSLTAHGGQKRAASVDRQQPAFQKLEAWVFLVLPTSAKTNGFASAPTAPKFAPAPMEAEPVVLPGAIVGASGQPITTKPLTAQPPQTLPAKPTPAPNAADPFDPKRFNALPKKGEK